MRNANYVIIFCICKMFRKNFRHLNFLNTFVCFGYELIRFGEY